MIKAVTDIPLDVLQSLSPLHLLAREAVAHLRETAQVKDLAMGDDLCAYFPQTEWMFYLLRGSVEVESDEGAAHTVREQTPGAKDPLLSPFHSEQSVVAREPSTLLCIDRKAYLAAAEQREQSPDYGIAEVQVSPVESEIFQKIYFAYEHNELVLPSMPDIAYRVGKAVQDSNAAADIARIIQADPPLAARLIQVANSPFYGGLGRVGNIREAVVRLGTTATRNIVTSFSLRQLFQAKSAQLHERIHQLWDHSALVGALCFVLARLTPGFDPDRALLAGLVHDIGEVPMLAYADTNPAILSDFHAFDQAIGRLRGMVGAIVLEKWRFDRELVTVALEAEEWARDPQPRADYCDLVLLAQLHGYVGTPRMPGLPRIDAIPAFGKLALGKLTPRLSLYVLEKAKGEVDEVRRMLTGS